MSSSPFESETPHILNFGWAECAFYPNVKETKNLIKFNYTITKLQSHGVKNTQVFNLLEQISMKSTVCKKSVAPDRRLNGFLRCSFAFVWKQRYGILFHPHPFQIHYNIIKRIGQHQICYYSISRKVVKLALFFNLICGRFEELNCHLV